MVPLRRSPSTPRSSSSTSPSASPSSAILLCLLTTFVYLSVSLTVADSAALERSVNTTSSSLILNESFIQSKILQRYHPMKNIKAPAVLLKLSGESGMLTPFSASIVPPYIIGSSGVLPNSSSLKTPDEAEWAFSPAPSSKLQVFTEKLIRHRPIAQAQTSSSSDSSLESHQSSAGAEDYYSGSEGEPSDEDLSLEQTQHQHQPFNSGGGAILLNRQPGLWSQTHSQPQQPLNPYSFQSPVSHESNSMPNASPYSASTADSYEGSASAKTLEQPQAAYSHPAYVALPPTVSSYSGQAPSSGASSNRRSDDETQELNRLEDRDYSSLSLDELENFAVIDEDQISRYFIKTHPKEILSKLPPPVPLSYIVREDDRTQWLHRNYSQHPGQQDQQQQPEPSFSTSLKNKYVSQEVYQQNYETTPAPKFYKYQQHEPESQVQTTTTIQPEHDESSTEEHRSGESQTSSTERGLLEHHPQQQQQSPSYQVPSPSNYLPHYDTQEKVSSLEYQSTVSPSIPTLSSIEAVTSTTTDATSIPGMPGIDYPILSEAPYTGFDCQKQRYKGFFADIATKCQAWHYCDFTDGHSTFLCPNGTLFSQVLLTCDWWFNVDCSQAQQLYVLNERLYRYIKPPKPSFPEDFHGPQVDLWLAQQLQLGNLPKMKKKIKDKIVINGNN